MRKVLAPWQRHVQGSELATATDTIRNESDFYRTSHCFPVAIFAAQLLVAGVRFIVQSRINIEPRKAEKIYSCWANDDKKEKLYLERKGHPRRIPWRFLPQSDIKTTVSVQAIKQIKYETMCPLSLFYFTAEFTVSLSAVLWGPRYIKQPKQNICNVFICLLEILQLRAKCKTYFEAAGRRLQRPDTAEGFILPFVSRA